MKDADGCMPLILVFAFLIGLAWYGGHNWYPNKEETQKSVHRLSVLSGVDPETLAGRIDSPDDFKRAILPELKMSVESARTSLWFASATSNFWETVPKRLDYEAVFVRYERVVEWSADQNAEQSEEVRRRAEKTVQKDMDTIWQARNTVDHPQTQ